MAGHSVAGWHREVTDTPPPGRQWTGFAYDAALGEFVLFGGDDFRDIFGDTWTRKHGLWTRRHPATSPSPRTGAAMVYDAATRQLLLFGGDPGETASRPRLRINGLRQLISPDLDVRRSQLTGQGTSTSMPK